MTQLVSSARRALLVKTLAYSCVMASSLLCITAQAQDAFPAGPITLIVPNPPGGSSDINARILAEPLSAIMKQPVVILNKPGLGGAIGAAQVAKAKPDGYTLLLALSSVFVAPEAGRGSGRKPLYELDHL